MHLRILVFLALIVFPFAALAGPCTRAEADRADHFARIGAVEAIALMGPSQDLRTSILSCDYNTFSNLFRVRVDIRWNGAFMRNNRYWSVGELTFNFDGTNRRYTEESASQTMIDYRNNTRWVPVVVLLLDEVARNKGQRPAATAQRPPTPSKTGTSEVQVFNNCGMDVRLAFRWHNRHTNAWQSGIWRIAQGNRTYLVYDNRRLVTSSGEYLYAVRTLSGASLVSGDNLRQIRGTSYNMRRRTGASFPLSFNLCN